MAEYKLAAALNAATFPLVTRYQARSVIIPQYDGKLRDPASNPQTNLNNNQGDIPQVIYCENVIPHIDGVCSVGYDNIQDPFPGAGAADDVFYLRDGLISRWYFSPAQGMNYVRSALGGPWVSTNPLAGAPLGLDRLVTTADINGVTYVLYGGLALLRWEPTGMFTDVSGSLVGAVVTSIRAICASGNYLIAVYGDNSIKWSSLTDPLDFTPSAATGAGSQIPIDMKGYPISVSNISGGFLIHCEENTVAAVYTQNVAQPWIFREVKNSGGWTLSAAYSRESSTGYIYQISSYGLQQLDLRTAEVIHPQIAEFITLGILEDFDPITKLLSISKDNILFYKVAFLAGRYLCISYGTLYRQYTHALWYDMTLKRWGKLKVLHADLFANLGAVYVLRIDGGIDALVPLEGAAGVIILGRYQLSRSTRLTSQEVELELLDNTNVIDIAVVANYNGTTRGDMLPMVEYSSIDNYRRYQRQIEATNLTFIMEGRFKVASILYTFTRGARS